MAFNTAEGRAEYTATAGQVLFTFTFKIYATTDIAVYKTLAGATPNDTTDILIETTDYTVVINGDNGGDVTLVSSASVGDTITIVRNLPITRTYDYQTGGTLPANTLDADQDYQTYLVLDRKLKIDRSFQLPSSVQGVSTTVSAPVANAGLKWNAAGTAIEYAPIATGSVYVNILNVDTMADLIGVDNTNTVSINVRGYNSIADGGGGLFNWDTTVNKSTADGKVIIDPSVSLALQGTGVGIGAWVRDLTGFTIDTATLLLGYSPDVTGSMIRTNGYTTSNDGLGDLYIWDSTINKSTSDGIDLIDPSVSLASQGTGVGTGVWVSQSITYDKLYAPRMLTHNMASDADYTLSASDNLYGHINITDSGIVLTATRNIILGTRERSIYVQNNTAQSLVFKTASGTGPTISSGATGYIVCDGTNIIGGSNVTSTSVQVLDASDALRISGSTVSLYKGNGTFESVTLPNGIGYTELWQDFTASRSSGVTYQAPTYPIMVYILLGAGTADPQAIQVSNDASTWVGVGSESGTTSQPNQFIVPSNHYYRVNGATIVYWSEMR